MPRIRTIKPEFWQNEELAEVSETSRLVALGVLNLADDEGWLKVHERLIESALFPITEPSMSIHECLIQLSKIGYLKLYDGKDGKKDGHVVNFTTHQKVNRPTPSKIKDLANFNDDSLINHGVLTAGREGKGREGKGTGNREQGNTSSFADDMSVIFDYWLSVMKKGQGTKLTPKRKSCIEARLKEKYSVGLIKQAIDNCSRSDHHTGQNDNNTVYDDLTLICRSGEKLEWFANSVGQGKTKEESYQEDIKRIADELDNGGSLFPDDYQEGETFDMQAHSEYEGLPHDSK